MFIILIPAEKKSKAKNTGGLAKFLLLKIVAKVMLIVNIDIQGHLINDKSQKERVEQNFLSKKA